MAGMYGSQHKLGFSSDVIFYTIKQTVPLATPSGGFKQDGRRFAQEGE
jgi:hypothetical protein